MSRDQKFPWNPCFTPVGLSLLFSNTVILFYSKVLPLYCYYAQFIIEKTHLEITMYNVMYIQIVTGVCFCWLFILAAVRHVVGMSLSSCWLLFGLFPSWFCCILIAATWRFAHVACYYSSIIISQMLLTCNYSHFMLGKIDSSLYTRSPRELL